MIASGTRIGHFVVEAQLGAGGLGVVYLAEDLKLKRKVALKFLSASLAPDQTAVRRLVREAQIAGALDHPNIAAVHEIGEWRSMPFIAMAYCAGTTVKARLAAGPLPVTEAVSILGQIARGLAHAHAAGVVHRDLKPANVMLGADGHVRILDFGLARVSSIDGPTATHLTADGSTLGTVAYMAPEQVRGEAVDASADVWALGVTLYEMLTGVLPFRGATVVSTMHAILEDRPEPVRRLRSDVPPWLESLVESALRKPRVDRTLTAEEIVRVVDQHREQTGSAAPLRAPVSSRRRLALIAGAAAIAVAVLAGWSYLSRAAQVRAARERDLPELARLVEREQFFPAFDLARRIEPHVGADPEWRRLFQAATRTIDIDSVPDGATVSYRPYGRTDESWRRLGQTPIRQLSLPRGLPEWRIEKDGYVPVDDVGLLPRYITLLRLGPDVPYMFVLDTPDRRPAGMVRASPRGLQLLAIAGLEHIPAFELQDFWIDRTEVTNREFKRFVDAGGYRERRYWTQPFVRNGAEVPWDAAIATFRDKTGRTGPSTWELGTYPEGKDDLPVGGVSWYEAAAYAEFAGKRLPTIFHWSVVADRRATSSVLLPRGRYLSDGPLPVGQAGAVSRYGTHDLAGNVKEWCVNEAAAGQRYTLGGGWSDPSYFFNDADARSPWDRSPALGFRCMKLAGGEPLAAALTDRVPFEFRDFSRERPVSDEVFAAFKAQYAYDHGDLAPVVRATDDAPRDWRHETVEINAAYGGERFVVHLFLPKRAQPPYQTLVYFPGINALHQRSSDDTLAQLLTFHGFVVQSGRAIAYPIYKSTHERVDELTSDFPAMTALFRDHVIMWSKDVQRTVDYLQTRPDVARDKIGYAGISWGGAMGTIMVGAEPRFSLAIFYVGGFYSQHARPEVEAINFAPRVRVPTLMLNGRYDLFFPVDVSQRFMFNLLGVREPDKRWMVYETGHALPRQEMIGETLTWLDRYFGPVAIR
jgi:dienelactone hydrolase/tRNA A-37 threonylcarbamoyl transferase component Bud32